MNARAPAYSSQPNARSRPSREFRLREIWDIARRRAHLITVTTLIVALLAVLYVLQVRPQFAATSEVMLDPRKSTVENATGVLSNLPADQPSILNQIEILTSHRFAGKVVDRFHLERDPEFANPGLAGRLFGTDGDPREVAIDRLRKRLKVAQAGFSSSIRITLTSADRRKATAISAGIAELYVVDQLSTKSAASDQARRWLTQRVTDLARQVKEAEAAVQKYKAEHNITIAADGTSALEKQIADLNSQLALARAEYGDKSSKAKRTEDLIAGRQLATAPQVVASPLISSLRTRQSEINHEMADLATRYGPNHPKMKELTAQRADIDTKISEEASRIAESVRNEAETSRAHVASLESTIRQIEDQNARKNQEAVELTALQSAAASARSLYQAFLMQYSQTENQQGILRPDAFVISASEVNETFGPQTKLLAVLSAIPAGLLLGLALALMAERGAQTSETGTQRYPSGAGDFAPQAAAVLPEMGARLRAADLVMTNPQSPFAAATSRLLSGILARVSPPATIVVTAAAPGSGRTTLALALARTAARSGIKVIVIDANRPHSHLAGAVGVAGWSGASAGHGAIEEFINPDSLSTALVMASPMPGYTTALSPDVLNRLVANLKTSMELVVIAAPPLSDLSARAVLAMGDVVLVAVDARRPALAPQLPGAALTVLTHAP
ncbi:GumC family protein [Rhizomicrobium electricum]|uniref:Polysaccharide biosynthesis tyrosine autokinase n=1 Tax=Rhizomicrobium electricum TaxID=480070 RepID=A0ABP3PBA6_9PROT|nr:exopolysaccharide transport family protein [Rhizomicrobium electricum]NIJ47917.1 uncharacterized protein involved in exopolysaccharide biosynthesis [Rhizomicrobium electricum]